MADDIDIGGRIQGLPQELQDLILDFTLIPPARTVTIDESYKPPWQLCVDRRTREVVAKAYYRDNAFTICSTEYNQPPYPTELVLVLDAWLSSLPAKHARLISYIGAAFDEEIYRKHYPPHRGIFPYAQAVTREAGDWLQFTEKLHTTHPNAIVSAQCRYSSTEGKWKELSFKGREEWRNSGGRLR